MEPADPAYALRAIDRALESTLRGQAIRVLTPEDFILFELLSTRDRDDDAGSVLNALGSELDVGIIGDEVRALTRSLPESGGEGRWQRLLDPA